MLLMCDSKDSVPSNITPGLLTLKEGVIKVPSMHMVKLLSQ